MDQLLLLAALTCYSTSDCVPPQYCSSIDDGVIPGVCITESYMVDKVEEEPEPVPEKISEPVQEREPNPIGPVIIEPIDEEDIPPPASAASELDDDKEFFIEKLDDYNEMGEELSEYVEELNDAAEELADEQPKQNIFQSIGNGIKKAWCFFFCN